MRAWEGELPFVSVIVPMYNEGPRIGNCLEALINQSYPGHRYEIIVVSDGSTDGSEWVVERFCGATAPGVRLLRQENQGAGVARNLGAASSRGEILIFIDADCVADRRWIEEMVGPILVQGAAGVQGAYRTRQKELVARFCQVEFEERYGRLERADHVDFIGSFSAAYRRDVLREHGGFNAGLLMNEDVDLAFRVSREGGRLCFNPNAIVYHLHPSTFSRYVKVKFWRGFWRTLIYRKFRGKALKDSYTPATLKLQSAAALLIALTTGLSALFPGLFAVNAYLAGIGTLSMLRFTGAALGKDLTVGLFSVPLLWARAFAVASGSVWAIGALLLSDDHRMMTREPKGGKPWT